MSEFGPDWHRFVSLAVATSWDSLESDPMRRKSLESEDYLRTQLHHRIGR